MAHNSSVPAVFNTHSLCILRPSKSIFDWNLALPTQGDTRYKDKYVRMLTSSHCPNRQIYRKVPNIYLVLFMLRWLPQVIYLFIFVGQCKISLHCTMFSHKVSQKFINLLRLTLWLKVMIHSMWCYTHKLKNSCKISQTLISRQNSPSPFGTCWKLLRLWRFRLERERERKVRGLRIRANCAVVPRYRSYI